MSDKKYTFWEAVFILPLSAVFIAFIMVATLPFSMLTAWARVKLWNWFVVPYLHLPPIPFWAMFALGIFAATFRGTKLKESDYKPEIKDYVTWFAADVIGSLLAVFVGWVIRTHLL